MPSAFLGAKMPSACLHCVLQCLGAQMPGGFLGMNTLGRRFPKGSPKSNNGDAMLRDESPQVGPSLGVSFKEQLAKRLCVQLE